MNKELVGEKIKNHVFHPCKCTDYNGGQCYNCLNGAHEICQAKIKCGKKDSKQLGVKLIFKK